MARWRDTVQLDCMNRQPCIPVKQARTVGAAVAVAAAATTI